MFHFDIPTWGNYGDKALFPVVRDAFRVFGGAEGTLDFTSAAALRREVDAKLVERINASADAVVIGGGGLFLQDTNPNRLSGWQWKISAEVLAALEVPLIVYALGDNRFPGQPEFDELMRGHVGQVLEQSVFFGLRNSGSIATMSQLLGPAAAESIRFQPCPTTIAGALYEPLVDRRPDPAQKVIAIQMLVHPRQVAAGFDAEVIHRATIEAARMLVGTGWTVLSTPFHPDDAEVSRLLTAQVPEVEEVRLYGHDIGFFSGFERFSSIPYVLGGRGHAQMIPFGVGSIPLSLGLHAKLGYFAHDIGHPELVIPTAPEGTATSAGGVSGGVVDWAEGAEAADRAEATEAAHRAEAVNERETTPARRAQSLAVRIVEAVESAYARGPELQEHFADVRTDSVRTTRDNHAMIQDALLPSSGSANPPRLRSAENIRAEEFHCAAVAEAEEFSAVQTREVSRIRREHRQKLDEERGRADETRRRSETARKELSARVDELNAEKDELAGEAEKLRIRLDEASDRLTAVEGRNAAEEAKVFANKAGQALTWRARRLVRRFRP